MLATLAVHAVLPLLLAAPDPAPVPAPRCLVSGRAQHLYDVVVTPPGAPSFKLYLDGVPLRADLTGDGPATLAIEAPLAFTAELPRASLPLRPRATERVADGRLTLTARSPLVGAASDGSTIAVTLALGEHVHLAPVDVRCAALTLADVDRTFPTIVRPPLHTRVVPRDATLGIFAVPSDVASQHAPLELRVEKGASFMLRRLGARGDAVEVAATWSDGTRLRGFAAASGLEAFPADTIDYEQGFGWGACGRGGQTSYYGPALLHGGAVVYDREDGVAWARAPRAVRVIVDGDEGWVRLDQVPGLSESRNCPHLDAAFVRAESLTYPHRRD